MRLVFAGSVYESTRFKQSLADWDTSVRDTTRILVYASFNQPIGNWDVSSANMATGAKSFSLSIGH
jgi:hypothetical protein